MKYVLALAQTAWVVPLIFANCNRSELPSVSAGSASLLDPIQGQEVAVLASAPLVPPPIARNYATRVILNIEVKEQVKTLADGVTYTYWTFGDEAPGKFIRVREGDLVEVHFSNHPDNSVAHNIDFHAATGPGGGGEASFVAPGHKAVFTWRAMNAGLYLYHCVAAPAGLHISNGMYGQILVEPKEGLPKVDREYQIIQGEFYTEGKFGQPGPQRFSMEKALAEKPEYVVFNGRVGALMGENAIKAKTGERVRLFLGNAGPSLTSSFHVVGEIFDNVYGEGGTVISQKNAQTTVVPVGGSSIVEFTTEVPGEYALVDHSMFRAFNKGAMGMMRVEGKDNNMVFSGKTHEEPYNPGTRLARMADLPPGVSLTVNASRPAIGESADEGARVYSSVCVTCHQADGRGLPNVFPPLAGSDYLMSDKDRSIRILLNGLKGPITVNGKAFNSEMPKPNLTDEQIASVLTYVRGNFENQGDAVTVADVVRVRAGAGSAPESPATVNAQFKK